MNAALQVLLVAVIVATAMSYAMLKFMPARWRKALAARIASLVTRSGLPDVLARRVESKLASGGACGSCDSCKACATTPKQEVSPSPTGYREIPIRRASS